MENLTANEMAYDMGYEDATKGNIFISYEDWHSMEYAGSHSAYKAGFEDAEKDYEDENYD